MPWGQPSGRRTGAPAESIAKAKRVGRYEGRVPTARRQATEVARLKAEGVRPSEIAQQVGDWTGERVSGAVRE